MQVVLIVGAATFLAGPLVPSAWAEEAGARDLAKRKAAKLGRKGKAAFKKGRYADAISAFSAAYEANPKPKYLYNLAKAYMKNGDLEQAVRTAEDFLQTGPSPKDRAEMEIGLAYLHKKLEQTRVQLGVRSEPAIAEFHAEAGGRTVGGTTPWSGWLPPGPCKLTVLLEGHTPAERAFVLALGEPREVAVRLEPVAAATPTPGPTVPPAVAPNAGVGTGTWIALGTGAALLAVGSALGLLARSAERDYLGHLESPGASQASEDDLTALRDRAVDLGTGTTVALAAGAVAGAAAGVLLIAGADGEVVAIARWPW